MKRILLLALILIFVTLGPVSAQTPAKPYSDLAPREVLTATWLMGYFNTIYTWAQATNASVTTLMSGVTYGTPLIGSTTTTVGSYSKAIVWNSTGLDYISMTASGVIGFEGSVVAVTATTGADIARYGIEGAAVSNGTYSSIIGSEVVIKMRTNPDWNVTASMTAPGVLKIFVDTSASATSQVEWSGRVITHEKNY